MVRVRERRLTTPCSATRHSGATAAWRGKAEAGSSRRDRDACRCSVWLGVAVMFDEASAVELVAKMLVESVCVWSMVATGDLDAAAAMLPCKLLRCGNEQPTDAAQ